MAYLDNSTTIVDAILTKKGREKYFRIFNNLIISDSILSKVFGTTPKYRYAWER